MSNSTDAILQDAFDLIEQGQLEQAQTALVPLLETEDDNPALWWIYAHAVQDSEIGIQALDRVIQLDPAYPGARELKERAALAQSAAVNAAAIQAETASAEAADEEPGDIADWENLRPEVERASQNTRFDRRFVLVIAAFLLIVLGGLLVWSGELDITGLTARIAPTAEPQIRAVSAPTEADSSPAAMPAATLAAVPTETEAPLSPAAAPETVAFITLVADAISDFEIDETVSGFRRTELGDALVLQICAVPGPDFQARLGGVMNAVVSLDADIPENAEAIAVSLVNCDDADAAARLIGVERSAIQAYADAEIEARDFQRLWKPLS